MQKRIFALSLFLLLNLFSTTAFAQKVDTHVPEKADSSTQQVKANSDLIGAKQLDKHAQILAAYLQTHNSPLQNHAQDFIDAAKQYQLDWRLVAAISGVESTFGKQIPGGYNGWGWGVYGNQAIYFNSWTEAIYTISKGLRENYINKGYTEPYSMNRIYAASPVWGSKVTFFMSEIDKYAKEFESNNKDLSFVPESQTAAMSASLALRSEPVLR